MEFLAPHIPNVAVDMEEVISLRLDLEVVEILSHQCYLLAFLH